MARALALALLVPMVPGRAGAETTPAPTIRTAVGGPVEGRATSIGIAPNSVLYHDGALYVSDQTNPTIRRLDAMGAMSVVAGDGTWDLWNEPSPTSALRPVRPSSMAFDAQDNLLFVDGSSKIRSVTPAGQMTTVLDDQQRASCGVGAPTQGYRIDGLAVDRSGALWFGNYDRLCRRGTDGAVTLVAGTGNQTGATADGGPATAAKLDWVYDVALTPDGAALVADYLGGTVRRIGSDGVISTVASGLRYPTSLQVDSAGRVFVTELFGYRVVRLDAQGGRQVVAGTGDAGSSGDGGPATAARLEGPVDIAIDPSTGALAIADISGHRVRLVSPAGTISTIAGNGEAAFSGDGGPANETQLARPDGVAVGRDGSVYVADTDDHRVRRIDAAGRISTIAGTGVAGGAGDGGLAVNAQLYGPTTLFMDDLGSLYIAESWIGRVRRVSPLGLISTVAGVGGQPGSTSDGGLATGAYLQYPTGVTVDRVGNVYIAESEAGRVRRVSPLGLISTVAGVRGQHGSTGDGGPATTALLSHPHGLAIDRAGNLLVAEGRNIRSVSPLGTITSRLDGRNRVNFAPYALTINRADELVFTSTGDSTVYRLRPDGTETRIVGHYLGQVRADLLFAFGVAEAPDGTVWVADGGNNRVRAVEGLEAPASPISITVTVGANFATSSWTVADDVRASVATYTAVAVKDGRIVASQSVEGDATSVSIPNLQDGTSYVVYLYATTSSGARLFSPPSTVTTIPPRMPMPPDAPTGVTVEPGSGFLVGRWAPPTTDGGSPVLAYAVYALDPITGRQVAKASVGADVRAASVPGLTNGRAYRIVVAAWSARGVSPVSGSVLATPAVGAPAFHRASAPRSAVAMLRPEGNEVRWLGSVDDGGSAIVAYSVLVADGTAILSWTNSAPSARSAPLPSLNGHTNAVVYVVPYSAAGFGLPATASFAG